MRNDAFLTLYKIHIIIEILTGSAHRVYKFLQKPLRDAKHAKHLDAPAIPIRTHVLITEARTTVLFTHRNQMRVNSVGLQGHEGCTWETRRPRCYAYDAEDGHES